MPRIRSFALMDQPGAGDRRSSMAMPATLMSAKQYEEFALTEEGSWYELRGGRPVEKPAMSISHAWAQSGLVLQLSRQLDESRYRVQFAARLKRDDEHYYIPDVCVLPISSIEPDRSKWRQLNVYLTPLPLVVEVWSPSTGDYDMESKIPEYRRRGDQEIWRLHPFDRTLTTWRRQSDGSYVEAVHHGGTISPVAFPGVTIDLDALFG
jgi:Uma2 family endonuclease